MANIDAKICPHCGTRNKPQWEFCAGCGESMVDVTQTIVGGTGKFAGATGSGTGRVNLAANAIITASGTITLA